jgi:serine/threonine-protein kinase
MTATGGVIGGRYRAESLLGRGGMAAVWLGRDLLLDRPVAIKQLSGAGLTEPMAAERFEQEARTVARLAHPNIVAVHDYGTSDGQPYLIMELVEGETVAAVLKRGRLTINQAVAIAAQTCDGLAAAHAAGIVHRDIKPSNLILTPAGVVKVCDFGIARMLHAAGQATLTLATEAIGTVSYMAPEQVGDQPIDHRVDLYGLGCTIYAMLTGAPPFSAESAVAIIHLHLTQLPAPVTQHRDDIPRGLEVLVEELLAKTPQGRPADATQVKARLVDAMPNQPDGRAPGADPLLAAIPESAALVGVGPGDLLSNPTNTSTDSTFALQGGSTKPPWSIRARGLVMAAMVVLLVVAAFLVGLSQVAGIGTPPDGSAVEAMTSAATGSAQPSATMPPTEPGTATPTTTRPVPVVGPSPTTPVEPIAAMRVSIQQQVDNGHLNPAAATDLYKKVDEIAREFNEGDAEEATKKVNELAHKLSDLVAAGKLTPSGYDELTVRLNAVAAFIGGS